MYDWPVMRLCERQLRDINPYDVLCGGLYRRCNTYKGGGGYDQFPAIYSRRNNTDMSLNEQFVVQLLGCPFNCTYCYVTPEGVRGGGCEWVGTNKLVEDYASSGFPVFHLMGGAPAIYLDSWPELLEKLPVGTVFHSDFLLAEIDYDMDALSEISKYPTQLHAVSIKGTVATIRRNTQSTPSIRLMLSNLGKLKESGIPFYLTYTGMSDEEIQQVNSVFTYEFGADILEDSFSIGIKRYKALEE